VSYNYNTLSQLTSETRSFTGVGSFALSYAYNLSGELTSITNPWNAQVGYNYDKMGRPTAVTGSGYAGVSSYINSIAYRAFGVKQMSYANSRTLSINYDNKLRMTRWDVAGVLGSDYEYRWEDTFRPSFAHSRTDATLDRWYNYDNVGRLHIARSGSEARAAYGETFNGQYDRPKRLKEPSKTYRGQGYQIAPVTVDTMDWMFTVAYANARTRGDSELMKKVSEEYLKFAELKFEFCEQVTNDLFGHQIRQILLLHANELNADNWDELVMISSAEATSLLLWSRR